MDVADSMDALAGLKKHKEDNPNKTGVGIIQNLSDWVKPNFIDVL